MEQLTEPVDEVVKAPFRANAMKPCETRLQITNLNSEQAKAIIIETSEGLKQKGMQSDLIED